MFARRVPSGNRVAAIGIACGGKPIDRNGAGLISVAAEADVRRKALEPYLALGPDAAVQRYFDVRQRPERIENVASRSLWNWSARNNSP